MAFWSPPRSSGSFRNESASAWDESVLWMRIDQEWSELLQKNRHAPDGIDESQVQAVLHKIKLCQQLPEPSIPRIPTFTRDMSMATKLQTIQTYIESFQYNFTGVSYFNLKKDRPYQRLMETAKEMTKDCLPIKCLEAVFLGLYLTSDLKDVERFPLSFKSKVGRNIYRHIVLVVRFGGKYGSIGLSRKDTLSYKALRYDTFGDLLLEFVRCYQDCYHKVLEVRVGLPPPHNTTSTMLVEWKFFILDLRDHSDEFIRDSMSAFTRIACSMPGDSDSRNSKTIQNYKEALHEAIQRLELQYGETSKSLSKSIGKSGPRCPSGGESGFSSGFDDYDDDDDGSDSESEFPIKNQRLRQIKEIGRARGGVAQSNPPRERPSYLGV